MKNTARYIVVAAVAVNLMLFGCSEKIVNDDSGSTTQVRISAHAALASGIASYARIIVKGIDMDPITVALSVDSSNNLWTGTLSVPAGLQREFTLEALDTLRGEGSIDDREEILYVAADTVDLTVNRTDTLDFDLFPVIPLLTTTPSQVVRTMPDTFSLTLAFYNAPAHLYGMACQVYYPQSEIIADSVKFFSSAADSLIEFASVDRVNPYVAISVTETNPAQALYQGKRVATVAKIYFRTTVQSVPTTGFLWVNTTLMQDANQQPVYPTNFRTGYTYFYPVFPIR